MKLIKEYRNGYADILAERAAENFYEKGDFVECDMINYYVFDYTIGPGGFNVYACRRV